MLDCFGNKYPRNFITENKLKFWEDTNNKYKFHILYKITTSFSKEYYYGIHSTNDLDDSYMGSGTLLKRKIKKYGVESFNKEILEIFDTRKEASDNEMYIVTKEKVQDPLCLNIKVGGDRTNNNYNGKAFWIEKAGKTNLERYGYKCALNNSKIKEKAKRTNLRKLGVDNPLKSPKVRDKINTTLLKKYNTTNLMSVDEIRSKVFETNLKRYGVKYSWQNPDVIKKIKSKRIENDGIDYMIKQQEKMSNNLIQKYGITNINDVKIINNGKIEKKLHRNIDIVQYCNDNTEWFPGKLERVYITNGKIPFIQIKENEYEKYKKIGYRKGRYNKGKIILATNWKIIKKITPEEFEEFFTKNAKFDFLQRCQDKKYYKLFENTPDLLEIEFDGEKPNLEKKFVLCEFCQKKIIVTNLNKHRKKCKFNK